MVPRLRREAGIEVALAMHSTTSPSLDAPASMRSANCHWTACRIDWKSSASTTPMANAPACPWWPNPRPGLRRFRSLPAAAVAGRPPQRALALDAGGRIARRRGAGSDLRLSQPRLPARHLRAEAGSRAHRRRKSSPSMRHRGTASTIPAAPSTSARSTSRRRKRSFERTAAFAWLRDNAGGIRFRNELSARQSPRHRVRAVALAVRGILISYTCKGDVRAHRYRDCPAHAVPVRVQRCPRHRNQPLEGCGNQFG